MWQGGWSTTGVSRTTLRDTDFKGRQGGDAHKGYRLEVRIRGYQGSAGSQGTKKGQKVIKREPMLRGLWEGNVGSGSRYSFKSRERRQSFFIDFDLRLCPPGGSQRTRVQGRT